MIKRFAILLVLLYGLLLPGKAQDFNKKLHLQSISNIGLINGSKGPSMALQTILGARFKHSFLGAGIGLDYYRYRTIPLFADIRHEFGKGRNVFVYGDVGYNYDWVTEKNKAESNVFSQDFNYKGGLYYDAGMGYKIGFKRSDALIFSAGYSKKKLKNVIGTGVCPIVGPCFNDYQTYRYYLSRLIFKVGWMF